MSTVAEMIRPASIGVALALYPSDASLPMVIERAPDSSGSPDTLNAVTIALAPPGSRTFVDLAPAGPTWHYRSRHISPAGFGSVNWTRWVAAKAKRLPSVLPNVPDIAAIDRWTTDIAFTPDATESANAAEWTAGDLVLGNGQTYAIDAGSSATYGDDVLFYLYWDPASPTEIQDSQTFSDTLGDGKIYLATCETTDDGEGSVTIIPVQGAPTIGAKHVRALTLAAIVGDFGVITAGLINNAESSPTAGIRINDAYAKPGTWLRYIDFAATGAEPFLNHPRFQLRADGSLFLGGSAENLIFNPGFEVSDTLMTPWREVVSQGTWTITATDPRSGSYCLRHDPAGMTGVARVENGTAGTRWEATEGDQFYFRTYYQTNGAGTGNDVEVRIIFRNGAGTSLQEDVTVGTSNSTSYVLLEVTGTAPAGTTQVCFELRVQNDGQTGIRTFDDCLARRLVDGTLLVGTVIANQISADLTLITDSAGNSIGGIEAAGPGDMWIGAEKDLRLQADEEVQIAPVGDLVLDPQGGTARINFDVPAGGTAGALVGYISVKVQGTERKIPYYAV